MSDEQLTLLGAISLGWRLYRSGCRIVSAENNPVAESEMLAGGAHSKAAATRDAFVLECGFGDAKCGRCPRWQAFRQLVLQPPGKDATIAFQRDGNFSHDNLESAQIDHRYAPTFLPSFDGVVSGFDSEPRSVPPKTVHGVDHAKPSAKQGEQESHVVGPDHLAKDNSSTPEAKP